MRTSVQKALLPWLAHFEGNCPRPYQDIDGAPTVAIGLLCPLSLALTIKWIVPSTGLEATNEDIERAYDALLKLPAGQGGGWYQSRVDLEADPTSIQTLLDRTISWHETFLRTTSHIGPNYDNLPGVCQMARIRLSWAVGVHSPWPHLDSALSEGRYSDAALECIPRDMARQPEEYRASMRACRQLYRMAPLYPEDELPDPLPLDGP